MLGDIRDDSGRQRHHLEIVDPKQAGAQAIVDIVGVIGDVVGNRGDLGLQRGKAPQLKIVEPDVVGNPDGDAARRGSARLAARRARSAGRCA